MCPQLQQQQQDQEQQHHGMMYTSDQLGGHLPPMEVCSAEHAATAYRSDAAGCLQKWQTSRYDIGDYMFGTTGNDYHLEADSSQFQNSLANDKTFTEQELMAWQLIPPEQMQSGMFSAQRGNMCFSASPGEPQCPDIGEASVMVCHQSGSSTPGIPDWEESKVR